MSKEKISFQNKSSSTLNKLLNPVKLPSVESDLESILEEIKDIEEEDKNNQQKKS